MPSWKSKEVDNLSRKIIDGAVNNVNQPVSPTPTPSPLDKLRQVAQQWRQTPK